MYQTLADEDNAALLITGRMTAYFGSAAAVEAYFDGTFSGDFATSIANGSPDYSLLDLATGDGWATQGHFFTLYGGLNYNDGAAAIMGDDAYTIVRGGAISETSTQLMWSGMGYLTECPSACGAGEEAYFEAITNVFTTTGAYDLNSDMAEAVGIFASATAKNKAFMIWKYKQTLFEWLTDYV